jgi:ubiquinone/menaquinone biosynthesis C-methylase UbiE
VRDGIPLLLDREPAYMGELDEPSMEDLLGEIEARGFTDTVHNRLKIESDFVYDYALNPTRADFRFLLPLTEKSTVLDLGAGLGAITREIARQVKEVVSVDAVPARLRFARHACRSAGLGNVTFICAGDGRRLPFDTASFDAAIVNGVLEWVPVTRSDSSPWRAQQYFLREVHRCLRPGGTVYIGIENRFGYIYFLGAMDHNGLRFTSIMPRSMASLVSRLAGKGSYRTLTHSRKGYRRLLEASGFGDTNFYWTFPNYRHPQAIVPMEKDAIDYFVRTHLAARTPRQATLKRLSRFAVRVGAFGLLAPSFGIVAVKR